MVLYDGVIKIHESSHMFISFSKSIWIISTVPKDLGVLIHIIWLRGVSIVHLRKYCIFAKKQKPQNWICDSIWKIDLFPKYLLKPLVMLSQPPRRGPKDIFLRKTLPWLCSLISSFFFCVCFPSEKNDLEGKFCFQIFFSLDWLMRAKIPYGIGPTHLQKSRRPIRVYIWVIQAAGENCEVERTRWAKVSTLMQFFKKAQWRGITGGELTSC